MINKAFEIVNKKVEAVLSEKDFNRQNVPSTGDEMVSLYTGEDTAYSVIYYKSKKHMVLRSCSMTEDGPDNEWKTMATWMFDPDVDKESEADSIGNDFAEQLMGPAVVVTTTRQKKKKKSNDDGGDPLFFVKRLVAVFPDMKDEIRAEEEGYESFRAVTFARNSIVPRVKKLVSSGSEADIKKLAELLSAQYSYGDIDTRSVITIVILNSIVDESEKDKIREGLDDELKTAWKAAEKFRGKKVKPGKKKKQSFMQKMMAESIEQQNALNNSR